MNLPLRIVFKSENWENFSFMIFFLGMAFILYKAMKWNIKIRREKGMDEMMTKGNIIRNWMFIICLILFALVCFFRLVF